MLYLQVYFNDALQGQVELNQDVITIGRAEGNDIRIDNPGVSSRHARVVREGEDYYIEDTESTNGTAVNGEPVSRHKLEYGDRISIFKHILKFSPLGLEVDNDNLKGHGANLADGSGTVELDVSNLGDMLRQQGPANKAYLVVGMPGGKQRNRPLNSPVFKIGKDPESDLVIRGWFTPRHIASVNLRGDAYYLVPSQRGKVFSNGNRLHSPVKLEDGDVFNIKGYQVRYTEKQNKPAE